MTALKYSAAAFALLLASSMAYAEDAPATTESGASTTTTGQSGTGTTAETGAQTGTTTGTATTDTTTSGTATTDTTDSGTTGTATTTDTTTTTGTTEVQKTDSTTGTGTDTSTSTTATTTDMTESSGTMSNAMLASQFMGQTVYSTANESVGEINDLVLNKELDTVTAIVGVGGFLGIGEKDVAIPVDQITAAKDENNNIRLTIQSSKEQLEAAPAFDRTALN